MQASVDGELIDIEPPPPRRHWRRWVILAALITVFALFNALSMWVETLWFGSLGFASVYWYTLRLRFILFIIFALLTVVVLRAAFWLLERAFASSPALQRRVITVNNQAVSISPARFVRPLGWAVSLLFGLFFGLDMSAEWERFALYLNQVPTNLADPIFQKPVSFYLFTLPVHQCLSGWLTTLAVIILFAAIFYALVSLPQNLKASFSNFGSRKSGYAAVSFAFAALLICLAWRTYLSRFPYLWQDHQTFSGVTFTEANYLLPGLLAVAIALLVSAVLALLNAFTERRLRLLLAALALPVAVYVVAVVLVPAYVHSFIVKPNELGRETPYIENNIVWTRRAYGIDHIELRDFDAEISSSGFDLGNNRATLDNIRLWDRHALQDTLRQIQEIRTYYDFPDVDVDRYTVGGEVRQMMLAAREIDERKLPEQSRNWVNERLIYTHGYGVTMNTSNEFTPEGMPRFTLSNMPVESAAQEIKVTRPEIYFGQNTKDHVYVKTKQKEFNYPQGEANNYTTYEGAGGIQLGGMLRRLLLAWELGDSSKLPFSDDVTAESRVLMRRNILERVQTLAPFLVYDKDPYIVIASDGRLYWMLDAFTETSNYPYSRHYEAGDDRVNYLRNSVKVTIDAYEGAVNFYVFDAQDPLVNTYRATFPALFHDASEMPSDLRAHVRYPDTLIKTQGEVYSLYHTQNTKVFFQREDVWSVASQISLGANKQQQQEPLDPYFVLMQLPGEQIKNEFVTILPFTPASRNNMIGWMAGRCDGENYGSLLVYNFPKSRLIEGPMQIEARIDQNAQLSSQFTLWNQQGSHVRRGNMLVIPINRSLLYVEPVYLQAERSPMPELRLVVLATQERLGYGQNFNEALANLFGDAAAAANTAQSKTEQSAASNAQSQQQTDATKPAATTAATTATQSQPELIRRAADDLADYRRLTAEGKFGEAGQKLESAMRALEELKRQQK